MSHTDPNQLYQSLSKLYHQMNRQAQLNMYKKHEIYRGQADLLLIIAKMNGASQRELAEQIDIRPSSMTEMVTKMEQAGLLLRKQDEKDRRMMRIYLTEQGKVAVDSITETFQTFLNSIFLTLPEEELEQMLILTNKLTENIEKTNQQEESNLLDDKKTKNEKGITIKEIVSKEISSKEKNEPIIKKTNQIPSYLL